MLQYTAGDGCVQSKAFVSYIAKIYFDDVGQALINRDKIHRFINISWEL